MRDLVRLGIVTLVGCAMLLGCSLSKSHGELPALSNPYGDWNRYWEQVTTALEIDPEVSLLKEWRLDYDEEGAVRALRLVIYMERGPSEYDIYTVSQNGTGAAHWTRTRLNQPRPLIAVPAHQFFAHLNSVGYRDLERYQAVAPPIRSWFHTTSGTITYGEQRLTHIIRDGRPIPAPSEGVTMHGVHGTLQMTRDIPSNPPNQTTTASKPGDSPPLYLMPEVGCWPESSAAGEVPTSWVCPGPP